MTEQNDQHNGAAQPAGADNRLIIRGLRVAPSAAPEREILQGIDLEVGPGEVRTAPARPPSPTP